MYDFRNNEGSYFHLQKQTKLTVEEYTKSYIVIKKYINRYKKSEDLPKIKEYFKEFVNKVEKLILTLKEAKYNYKEQFCSIKKLYENETNSRHELYITNVTNLDILVVLKIAEIIKEEDVEMQSLKIIESLKILNFLKTNIYKIQLLDEETSKTLVDNLIDIYDKRERNTNIKVN